MDALVAIIIVGIVIKLNIAPLLMGQILVNQADLKKGDNPKRPKTIEGIALGLFIYLYKIC